MVGPWPYRAFTFRALSKTYGQVWLRCDVCRRYARLKLAGLHDVDYRAKTFSRSRRDISGFLRRLSRSMLPIGTGVHAGFLDRLDQAQMRRSFTACLCRVLVGSLQCLDGLTLTVEPALRPLYAQFGVLNKVFQVRAGHPGA
jgi:hypothetical protein